MNRIRNPFNKKHPAVNGTPEIQNENARPASTTDTASQHSSYAGSRESSSISIKRKEEPTEYKLSGSSIPSPCVRMKLMEDGVVVNGGVYLPVSPWKD